MNLTFLLWLSNPVTWLVIMMIISGWSRVFRRPQNKPENASRIVNVGSSAPDALGNALMFLCIAYRPNHSFMAKAQIVQREDADDDGQGGPDTAKRHLMRQLRRIRRGEPVDSLVWRLE